MLALAALQPVGLIPLNGLHQPDIEWRALVQTRLHRASMRNAIVQPDRRSVQRAALRPTDHHFVRELVHELQAELAGSGNYDGGAGDPRDPYNDPRWAQRYLPEFEKRWRRYARPVGGSWRM